MRTVRQFVEAVENLEQGESIEVDIRICPKGIKDKLREYIEEGILKPSENELKNYDTHCRGLYRSGWWIADEMTYIKKGKR